MKYDFKNENGKIVGSIEKDNNKLYFYGDIAMSSSSKWSIEDKCPQDIVNFLEDLENEENIEIHINSGGGSVFGGLSIYNVLKAFKGKKTVYIEGLAGSIASIISLVGDEIYIYDSAMFMVHKPLRGVCGYYNAIAFTEFIEALDKCEKAIIQIYLQNVVDGITEQKIAEMLEAETWLVGEEACNFFNMHLLKDERQIVARVSECFVNYKNMPKQFLKQETNEEQQMEIEKQKILNELELTSLF